MKIVQVMAFLLGTALAQDLSGDSNSNNGDNSPSNGSGALCPAGLYGNPQCCSIDVLGVSELDCKTPSTPPSNQTDFKSICDKSGKAAKCCAVPTAGQAVLCQDAV